MWEDPDLGKRLNWLHKYYAIYWCILRWRAPVGAILPMLHVKNAWKRRSCLFGKISMQIAGGWLNRLVSPGGAPSPKTSTTAQRPHTNTNTYILHRNINTNTNTLNFSNAIDKILPRKSYVYIQSNATKNVKSKGLKEAHDCIIGRDLWWAFGNPGWKRRKKCWKVAPQDLMAAQASSFAELLVCDVASEEIQIHTQIQK